MNPADIARELHARHFKLPPAHGGYPYAPRKDRSVATVRGRVVGFIHQSEAPAGGPWGQGPSARRLIVLDPLE